MLEVQSLVTLKVPEANLDPDNPWADDLLNRSDIATRLTNLIANQQPPLSISLHGPWGTGKTFLLVRWEEHLKRNGFNAIYFNAWEDDFCDDPLLAILGQLQDTFKDNTLKALIQQVTETGLKLVKKNLLSVAEKHTGLTLEIEKGDTNLLNEYIEQRATKDELKNQLAKLAEEIWKKTDHPLVFIVDELDRCRPTFAIELLERVKHIFAVPNLVFIFGINRDELTKSLSAVYGNINTDIYLRRFFDFEFNLSEIDSQHFARNLMTRFNLAEAFRTLGETNRDQVHVNDYKNYVEVFPILWSALGMSLRDIDYSIRLLALVARNVPPRTHTHPFILGILIAMKFKRHELYQAMIAGDFSTAELMNYMEAELRENLITPDLLRYLDRGEGFLYCYDKYSHEKEDYRNEPPGEAALDELSRERDSGSSEEYLIISNRAQMADARQINRIKQAIIDQAQVGTHKRGLANLGTLIDTFQEDLRR